MRARSLPLTALALVFATGAAYAAGDSGLDDALKTAGCSGCHSSDAKKVGPAMKSLGQKYTTPDAFVAAFHKNAMHKSVKATDDQVKQVAERAIAAK